MNAAVVLIWKFPLTFPQQAAALSITHLFVLAMGAFFLARERNLATPFSIFVALVVTLNGWIVCWGATDWFGALGAFAWLPWAWWGMERALDSRRSRWRFLWPALFVYLLVTGGFPYTVLMLGAIAGWLGLKSLGRTREARFNLASARRSGSSESGSPRRHGSLCSITFMVRPARPRIPPSIFNGASPSPQCRHSGFPTGR